LAEFRLQDNAGPAIVPLHYPIYFKALPEAGSTKISRRLKQCVIDGIARVPALNAPKRIDVDRR
jgi:hypothetical protein